MFSLYIYIKNATFIENDPAYLQTMKSEKFVY